MSLTMAGLTDVEDLAVVERALDEFFEERIERAGEHGEGYRQLWQAARLAGSGGKKLRPALVVAAHHALGGTDDRSAIQVATAFELLHTAFLLHDDVIDGDLVRRGRPNLLGSRVIEARATGASGDEATVWGQASAILAGDLLIHAAQSIVARLDGPSHRRTDLLDLLDRCVFVTAAGELADVAFSTRVQDAPLAASLAMTQSKTASYTFEGPLAAGALLAEASPDVVAGLMEFGATIGTAFQLRDDLLGVFGVEEVTGKSVLNDLRSRKQTPLMAYARSSARGSELDELLMRPLDEATAESIRGMLVECGAREYIEGLIANRVRRAIEIIDTAPFPVTLRVPLRKVVIEATERVT
jgi:geranylgeranyl diphosphate synthase type II